MKDYKIKLKNGWVANFTYKGEFKMACEYWDLFLTGPNQEEFSFFKNKIVLVNDYDGTLAEKAIQISTDSKYAYLNTGEDEAWVISFDDGKISPHRLYIRHNLRSKYLSAYERPAYKGAQEYVQLKNKLIYLTFPFLGGKEMDEKLNEYLAIRRKQLESTYFA